MPLFGNKKAPAVSNQAIPSEGAPVCVNLTLRGLAQAKPQDSLRPMREHIQRLQKREAHLQKVRPPPPPRLLRQI